MINKISEAINQITNEKQTIYVLKGFNSIFTKLSLSADHIFDMKLYENLNNIFDIDKKQFLSDAMLLLQSGSPYLCLYEEMFIVIQSEMYGIIKALNYKIVEIDIGIFNNQYPGYETADIEKFIEKYEQDTIDSNELQKVYMNFFQENGNLIIEYNLIDDEYINKYIKLFCSYSDSYQFYPCTENTSVEIYDNSAQSFVVRIFNEIINNNIKNINFKIVENKANKSILKFITAFNSSGVNIHESRVESSIETPELYEEYLEILRRKNQDFNFLLIPIYKDPFNSKDIREVNQSIIIDTIYKNIIRAKNRESVRDIFVTAPTGAGKSILFQIPAILAAEKHNLVTIVISPLISLMKDQTKNIQSMTKCAATINSDYTPFEKEQIKEKIKNGDISILYISPETLLSNADISTFIGEREIGLLVIDEAHTVATWGKNFRPDYWYLGDYLDKLRHRSKYLFPIATFTATATIGSGTDDMYHDIIESLNMTVEKPFIGDVKRTNIVFDINVCKKDHAYAEEKDEKVIENIKKYIQTDEKTLVYFPFVRILNETAEYLPQEKFVRYYGDLDKTVKDEALDSIKNGSVKLVLATKAFGMGIDVKDINTVYHYAPTGNLADYVQEIGRAARTRSMTGVAATDYYREDFRYINKLYGMSQIQDYHIIGVLKKILYRYKSCNKRNFMVSTEEFAHIFSADDDIEIESKLKATILAIKKDFAKTANYVPLIFKPRSMFTKGLFFIGDSKLSYIESIGWKKYLTKKYERTKLQKMEATGTAYSYLGDIYSFDFKQCWEENYNGLSNGMSFGAFKRAFFTVTENGFNLLGIDKSAFADRMMLKIEAKHDENFDSILNKTNVFLSRLKETLDDIKVSKKHFSIKDLASQLCIKLNGGLKQRKLEAILDPLLNMLIDYDRNITFGKYRFCSFNSQTEKYHIESSFYDRIISNIKKELYSYFSSFANESTRVSFIDASKDQNKKMRKNILLIVAQILELLDLISYSLQNGDRPEFFIRVNSEKAISRVVENCDYHSATLDSIRNLHYQSVKYMTYFFEELKTDTDRWNFIEDYFLGRVDDDYKINMDIKTKIKSLDQAKEQSAVRELAKAKEEAAKPLSTITVYTVFDQEDECSTLYYISDQEIALPFTVQRISVGCDFANNLLSCKSGDVFSINGFQSLVEKIETYDLR